MRIQEIADITGLSKKAINLYEKKECYRFFGMTAATAVIHRSMSVF